MTPRPEDEPMTETPLPVPGEVAAWEAEVESMTEEEFWAWMADGGDTLAWQA
jgi:hypothetical protein